MPTAYFKRACSMASSTADPLVVIRKAWVKAAKDRQGPMCVYPIKGDKFFPPHVIDLFGFGVEFCKVPDDYERKSHGL